MIHYQKTTLPNGLRIIQAPMKDTKAVSVMVLVGVGSRYEEKNLNGISHFLEHVFFQGTQKRPTALDITQELDAVGASFNAFTSEEETGFYVRAESSHFDLAVDILADILFNSKFEQCEIDKEKSVIIQEINMYQDTPQQYINDLAKKLFYGETALGKMITGEKATVSKFTRDNFISYRNKSYCPKNMLIVISGAEDKFNWSNVIKEKFSALEDKKYLSWERVLEKQVRPQTLVYHKKTDQTHLALGLRTFPRNDSRRPILTLINNILGDTMSSRLFTEVREKRGLAYYVSSDLIEFHDAGMFQVNAGVDNHRVKEAIKVILQEFSKIKSSRLSKKELNRAKENLKGRLYLGLEDSLSVASFLAEQELLRDKIKSPEELIAEIYKVSSSDIMKLSKEIFVAKNLNLAMIGPFKEKKEFEKILRI